MGKGLGWNARSVLTIGVIGWLLFALFSHEAGHRGLGYGLGEDGGKGCVELCITFID